MLDDLRHLEAASSERFYPVSTTAIVICCRLCDALGLSDGMRGAVSDDNLVQNLQSPPQLARLLRWRGGFFEIFALVPSEKARENGGWDVGADRPDSEAVHLLAPQLDSTWPQRHMKKRIDEAN